ncbi:Uu.00g058620.m01.CDS01 [Anthostomella pinea]|uniref:Uu.00g058620.m01.CDS01 n=1 Tax=Anthostomella pinea TaxID=933095 RepID=A0AAI8YM90_9PEZI|nr:Uu.00g058620.m01.CDS01 [Anthostomella pinea]
MSPGYDPVAACIGRASVSGCFTRLAVLSAQVTTRAGPRIKRELYTAAGLPEVYVNDTPSPHRAAYRYSREVRTKTGDFLGRYQSSQLKSASGCGRAKPDIGLGDTNHGSQTGPRHPVKLKSNAVVIDSKELSWLLELDIVRLSKLPTVTVIVIVTVTVALKRSMSQRTDAANGLLGRTGIQGTWHGVVGDTAREADPSGSLGFLSKAFEKVRQEAFGIESASLGEQRCIFRAGYTGGGWRVVEGRLGGLSASIIGVAFRQSARSLPPHQEGR